VPPASFPHLPESAAFVLDASVTVAWCFADEATPHSAALLERLEHGEAWVPTLWPLEIANILLSAEKRGRITAADGREFLSLLEQLPIRQDDATGQRAWSHTYPLAREEGLTSYDAAYLELALRRNLPLATFDKALQQAATRQGIIVLGSD
jgi:predicted nucleic acid-binding protein